MRPSVVRALCFCGREGGREGTFTRFSVRQYARGCWNRIYGHMWAWGKRIKLDFWLYDTRCVFGHFVCVGWREEKLTRFLVGQYIHMMSTERKKNPWRPIAKENPRCFWPPNRPKASYRPTRNDIKFSGVIMERPYSAVFRRYGVWAEAQRKTV